MVIVDISLDLSNIPMVIVVLTPGQFFCTLVYCITDCNSYVQDVEDHIFRKTDLASVSNIILRMII